MKLRFSLLLLALALVSLASGADAQTPAPAGAPPAGAAPTGQPRGGGLNLPMPRPPCTPQGELNFVCGPLSVEDMVLIPGGRWIIGSSFRPKIGIVYLIDAKNHTSGPAPIAMPLGTPEKPYDNTGCQAPNVDVVHTHGLALRKGTNGISTLYVVAHDPETVQIFRVDARGDEPKLTWIGCVPGPPDSSGNAISPLPDGGFAITKMHQLDQSMLPPEKRGNGGIYDGDITGVVYTWEPGAGYKEIPNTALSGPNGLEVSPDGKYAFIADYGRDEIFKVAIDGSAAPVVTKMPFKVDNVRYAPDGKLFATGQYINKTNYRDISDWGVVKLDPDTMKISLVKDLLKVGGTSAFWDATTTLQVGNELWISTFHGDRIVYLTLH